VSDDSFARCDAGLANSSWRPGLEGQTVHGSADESTRKGGGAFPTTALAGIKSSSQDWHIAMLLIEGC
jgi:hypothetical protein